jgi:hypothetical protein
MSLAPKPVYANRRVVLSPYFADANGRLRPSTPVRCALLHADGPCAIKLHKWRPRKTGPLVHLACFHCETHRCFFTVYPEIWLPFGRRPMAVVTHSGLDLIDGVRGPEAWTETAFGASVDASANRPWPLTRGGNMLWREKFGRDPYGVLRTQERHLVGANRLFALTNDLHSERGKVAAFLHIDLADVETTASRARDGPRLKVMGQMGVGLLSTIGQPRRRVLVGLVRLGADRRYWGPPNTTLL